MIKTFTAAMVAAVALTAAASASAADVEPGRSAVVRYADLDLASAAGQAALDRRVAHAVTLVCGRDDDLDLGARMERRACRTVARASASHGLQEAMLHRADRVQVAAATLPGR